MKLYNYTVVVEKDEDGNFLAICPALQGCYSEGSTKEEAIEMIKDAIKLHIEDRMENGEALYEEVFSSKVEVAV
ncbi:MAG: type II toxin-antitoxin system HicB family antitoxin [Chitinophagaceae bacterium]|nr:type II toxin-antitoxin system HicB family antitoxin [Chitinophagaceae bacterium]